MVYSDNATCMAGNRTSRTTLNLTKWFSIMAVKSVNSPGLFSQMCSGRVSWILCKGFGLDNSVINEQNVINKLQLSLIINMTCRCYAFIIVTSASTRHNRKGLINWDCEWHSGILHGACNSSIELHSQTLRIHWDTVCYGLNAILVTKSLPRPQVLHTHLSLLLRWWHFFIPYSFVVFSLKFS